jgi:hypothetical protein
VGVLDAATNSIRAAIRIAFGETISVPESLALALQTVSTTITTTITTTISATTSTIRSVPEFGLAVPVVAALAFVAFAVLAKRGRSQ